MHLVMNMLMIILICMIIMLLNLFFSMIKIKNTEKKTPFECGFNPVTKAYIPFSLPFYMILLMFLIFDVEIILLLPMIFHVFYMNSMAVYLVYCFFLLILVMTALYEYSMGYLNWLF